MRMRAAGLAAAMVLGTIVWGAPPAHAGAGTCGGEVDLVSSTPATIFISAEFTFQSTVATACTGGHVLDGWSLTAGCNRPTGGIGTFGGHSYTYTPVMGSLVFSGGITGALTLVPAAGQSCLSGATRFHAVGALMFG